MDLPDIAVIYDESFLSDDFDDFQQAIASEKLTIIIESKPKPESFACPEWVVPTAIMIFIGKSYFDGFLKEMGKDHYQKLKNNLAELTNKQMSKPRIEPIIIGTKGKSSSNNNYSMAFSIYAEANDGNRFKLLIPKPSVVSNYTEIIYRFLEFVNDYHMGIKNEEAIGFNMNTKSPSGLILVHMNLETKNIELLDHNLMNKKHNEFL